MDFAILPPPYRLALAYAPRAARSATFALFALDQRLGGIVGAAREPLLAQIKLAWWRDRLGSPSADWPVGEPLLAKLTAWGDSANELTGLADGWEALLIDGNPDALIAGRAQACAALAGLVGQPDAADAAGLAGRQWAECEMLANKDDRSEPPRLPKQLRALAVLIVLLRDSEQSPLRQLLVGLRTGLFG